MLYQIHHFLSVIKSGSLDMITFVNEQGISFHEFGVDFEDRGWFEIGS